MRTSLPTLIALFTLLLTSTSVKVPKFIDWRSTGYNSTVIDMSTCNATWAAAAVTIYQFEYLFAYGSSAQQNLSVGYIVDCSGYGGCRNGTLAGAIDFLIANGTYNITGYSNKSLSDGISNSSNCTVSSGSIYKSSRTVYRNTYYKISNDKLRQLLTRAPTANEALVDNTFYSYSGTATYKCPYYVYNDGDLNSAVVIVGFTTRHEWIVRYFRGLSWGNGGYMILKSGKDCGIRRKVYQIWTSKYSPKTAFTFVMVLFVALVIGI